MNIKARFSVNEKNKTYRRVDASYKVNTFLGYNEDGQMSMVITEKSRVSKPNSSRLINVSMTKRDDGKTSLKFDLIDKEFETMFLAFCKDVIAACEQAGADKAISTAIQQWKSWKKMFESKPNDLLDKNKIKGLIGELIQIRDSFIPNIGERRAIDSWMGPALGHKDFEIDNTWYEVKCVNENARQVHISSLEQLDSDLDGFLMVCRLEETSSVNNIAISLNSVVIDVLDLLEDIETIGVFKEKLESTGYDFSEEYSNVKFMYKGTEKYTVKNDFPCLRRSNISSVIGEAEYTLMLSGLSSFKED